MIQDYIVNSYESPVCEEVGLVVEGPVLFREAIMEKVLKELDDNHPTLFFRKKVVPLSVKI